jgi:hypothetical protein
LIPTPIRQVLSTIRKHQVQALLIGGQACVFYGAAQFSKDIDLVLLAADENFSRLLEALSELRAMRIAVPRFDPAVLARGQAVHFRCQGEIVEGLRVDVMTRLRDLPEFEALWSRRTTITDESGEEFNLMAIEDLVQAEKRPLLRFALSGEIDALRQALQVEVSAEQAKDRAYWAPLKAEIEAFRRAERQGS